MKTPAFAERSRRGIQCDNRDRSYCFSFSRSAFTVRCVVGTVNPFGVLAPEHEVMPDGKRAAAGGAALDRHAVGRAVSQAMKA